MILLDCDDCSTWVSVSLCRAGSAARSVMDMAGPPTAASALSLLLACGALAALLRVIRLAAARRGSALLRHSLVNEADDGAALAKWAAAAPTRSPRRPHSARTVASAARVPSWMQKDRATKQGSTDKLVGRSKVEGTVRGSSEARPAPKEQIEPRVAPRRVPESDAPTIRPAARSDEQAGAESVAQQGSDRPMQNRSAPARPSVRRLPLSASASPDYGFTQEHTLAVRKIYRAAYDWREEDFDPQSQLRSEVEDLMTFVDPLLMKNLQAVRGEVREGEDCESPTSGPLHMWEISVACLGMDMVVDQEKQNAMSLIQELLAAGEITVLDAKVRKAAQGRRIKPAFFEVLDMNLNAARNAKAGEESDAGASMGQILQHIRTRAEEELENVAPPATGLLHKMLRFDDPQIRLNQLRHFLAPQSRQTETQLPGSIAVTVVGGTEKPEVLVKPEELAQCVDDMVFQYRDLERQYLIPTELMTETVESIRLAAIEARFVIIDVYGPGSSELAAFDARLQSVFPRRQ